jgi:hypothetical protein
MRGGEADVAGSLDIGCEAKRNGWKGKLSRKWLDLAIFI